MARQQLPRLGVLGGLRWFWRQLTSMRTALFLLLILAVAAVPGSIFPQRSINATRVTTYLDQHKTIGPWLDRIGMFDVFSSPWFSAVYLLLVISLIGCIVPRTIVHARSLRSPVPRVPRRLERLRASGTREVDAEPADVIRAARAVLGRKHYRLREDEVTQGAPLELAAEGGRMRETGNLLFHTSLVIVIIAVAAGHLLGFRGDVIVPVGQSFTSTASRYDTQQYGPWTGPGDLKDWSLTLDKLDVSFEDRVPVDSAQWGQPRSFTAAVTTTEGDGSPRKEQIAVNHPLAIGGADVYLLGNGYAPTVTVKDAKGNVLYDQSTPFLPQDNMYRSVGAIKVGALPNGKQLGFFGFFLPTAAFSTDKGPYSMFPGLANPALVLGLYEGTLFPNGRPQSVYTLNTSDMKQVKDTDGQPLRLLIKPGQTVQLPGGRGSITLNAVPRWAGLSVRSDPGKMPALIFALLALAGLIMSMTLRRRRIFVRASAAGTGPARTLITIGGLAKGEDPRLQVALDALLDDIAARATAGGTPGSTPAHPTDSTPDGSSSASSTSASSSSASSTEESEPAR